MNVEKAIDVLQVRIGDCMARIEWLKKRRDVLEKLPEADEHYFATWGGLDFNQPSHKEVISVVRTLGGKWEKSKSGGGENKIDYVRDVDGVRVRCYAGEPPPSCKLVEVEEVVPEQVIPAHTVKKFKMVCAPSVGHDLAVAIDKGLFLEKITALAQQQPTNERTEI